MRARAIVLVVAFLMVSYGVVATSARPLPLPIQPLPAEAFVPVPTPEPTVRATPRSLPPSPTLSPSPIPSHTPVPTVRPTPHPSSRPVLKSTASPPAVGSEPGGATLTGWATYYCCTARYGNGDYAAAGPALRKALGGDPAFRGRRVTVCYGIGAGRWNCVVVRLVDWCACNPPNADPRLIDLESVAFASIAPLSLGKIKVTVSW